MAARDLALEREPAKLAVEEVTPAALHRGTSVAEKRLGRLEQERGIACRLRRAEPEVRRADGIDVEPRAVLPNDVLEEDECVAGRGRRKGRPGQSA